VRFVLNLTQKIPLHDILVANVMVPTRKEVIMSNTHTVYFVLSLFLSFPVQADTCDETAEVRVEAADQLIVDARVAEAIDQAPLLERAQILLENTLEADPSCEPARALLALIETLEPEFRANSAAAAVDVVLSRAGEILLSLETEGVSNPDVLETLRFQLAALDRELGENELLDSLTERAAALSSTP
jgi:hypothetical protein